MEQEYRVALEGWPVDLVCRLDLVETDSTVRDLKTGAKRLSASRVATDVQLTGYHFALEAVTGRAPRQLAIDQLIAKATPEAVTHVTTRTTADVAALFRRFETMLQAIERDVWIPCAPDAWQCTPRWCGYHNAGCPYVNGVRRPTS